MDLKKVFLVINFQCHVSGLGPITPIGGSLLILGWVLLIFQWIKTKNN